MAPARSGDPEVYRGRRKRINVLGIVFGALVALVVWRRRRNAQR